MSAPTAHPSWQSLHRSATVVDLHAHPSLKVSLLRRRLTGKYSATRTFNPFSFRTGIDRLEEGGVGVVCSVIHPPERGLVEDCSPLKLLRWLLPFTWRRVFGKPAFAVADQMLTTMEERLKEAEPRARLARSAADLEAILELGEGRPVAFVHCLEGAHCLSGDLANLDDFAARGVAYMTLAHFYANEAAPPVYSFPDDVQIAGCFQGDRDLTLSLTPFGEQVVERMLELGMMIDVSHATPAARRRIYDIVGNRAPLLATHVGAYELNPNPYNLEDWELKKIADSGGVASVIFMSFYLVPGASKRGLDLVTRTLRHFLDVAGEDHVGFGSDFDGFTDPPDDLKHAGELPRLTQRLAAQRLPPEVIRKVLGGNALRVLREGWGGRGRSR